VVQVDGRPHHVPARRRHRPHAVPPLERSGHRLLRHVRRLRPVPGQEVGQPERLVDVESIELGEPPSFDPHGLHLDPHHPCPGLLQLERSGPPVPLPTLPNAPLNPQVKPCQTLPLWFDDGQGQAALRVLEL
jgi:hypothetical protein